MRLHPKNSHLKTKVVYKSCAKIRCQNSGKFPQKSQTVTLNVLAYTHSYQAKNNPFFDQFLWTTFLNVFTVHLNIFHKRVSRILSTCRVSTSVHAGIHHPLGRHPPADTPPPSRRLLQRTVRILLECILVQTLFCIVETIKLARCSPSGRCLWIHRWQHLRSQCPQPEFRWWMSLTDSDRVSREDFESSLPFICYLGRQIVFRYN